MFTIITSKKDPAGLNIKQSLIEQGFKETEEEFDGNKVYQLDDARLYTIEEDSIYCEDIDKKIDAELFIFATKHKSEKEVKTLCCHVPGNFGKAELGGRDKQLCFSDASFLKELFLELNKNPCEDFETTVEVDHHGPYLERPVLFIEIGSSENEWGNKKAADAIAKTIITAIKKQIKQYKTAILIGGQHYNHAANKILLKTDYAISHICPKYQLQNLDKDMLMQMINRSKEKADIVLLDWKGLGKEKERIKKLLEKLNLNYKKTKNIE